MRSERLTYCTAADMARVTGYDRSTVLDWIRCGKVRARKRLRPYAHHRIFAKYFRSEFINKVKKTNPHSETWWTDAELYILRSNIDEKISALERLIPHRTKTAIKVKRTRERRKLYV